MVKITLYRNYKPETKEFELLDEGMRHAFIAMELESGFLTKVESNGEVLWKWRDDLPLHEALADMEEFLKLYEEVRREVSDE